MSDKLPLVLVVDDNEMNRDMLGRRLQRQGCDVVMAENGAVALDLVAQRAFDLVLLDIMMPQMSGYEVLERLKADERTKQLPIIMISAIDDMDSVVKCIELGAEDYLFKPFNPVLLKARVGAILGRQVPHFARHEIEQAQTALASLLEAGLTEAQQGLATQVEQHLDTLSRWLKKSNVKKGIL